MKILVALYMKFICPAVAQPPYSTWDKVIVLGASTTYALKLKSSSKYTLFVIWFVNKKFLETSASDFFNLSLISA